MCKLIEHLPRARLARIQLSDDNFISHIYCRFNRFWNIKAKKWYTISKKEIVKKDGMRTLQIFSESQWITHMHQRSSKLNICFYIMDALMFIKSILDYVFSYLHNYSYTFLDQFICCWASASALIRSQNTKRKYTNQTMKRIQLYFSF